MRARLLVRIGLLIGLLVAAISAGLVPPADAQQPTDVEVLWIRWADRGNPQVIRRELEKINPDDRVLVYFHGGGFAKPADLKDKDEVFLRQVNLLEPFDKIVIFDFLSPDEPSQRGSIFDWTKDWLGGWLGYRTAHPTQQQVGFVTQHVKAIAKQMRRGSLPNAAGFSAGGVILRESVFAGAEYNVETLLDVPDWAAGQPVTLDEMSRVNTLNILYSQVPEGEGFWEGASLHGAPLIVPSELPPGKEVHIVDMGAIGHRSMLDPHGSVVRYVALANRGELIGNVAPLADDELAPNLGIDCPPRCPPFFPPKRGGAGALYPAPVPAQLGGIDFSSVDVTYLVEYSNEDAYGLAYVVRATKAGGGGPTIDPELGTQASSDAFFVWLSLPNGTFWANLNPTEPERVIDDDLGRTDVGRVLLEADLQLKKDTARLTHPESDGGREFWTRLDACARGGNGSASERDSEIALNHRTWVVPGEVTVSADDSYIYIVDAPLDVKLESEYARIGSAGEEVDASEFQLCGEAVLKELVLPKLIEEVNQGPQYRDLRSVFYSRVLAEWYKSLSNHGLFQGVADQGDIESLRSEEQWNPEEIFDRYKDSFENGEYDITTEEEAIEGNLMVTRIQQLFMGGIDLTTVHMNPISQEELLKETPELEQQLGDALLLGAYQDEHEYWAGGALVLDVTVQGQGMIDEPRQTTGGSDWWLAIAVGVGLGVLGALAIGVPLLLRRL